MSSRPDGWAEHPPSRMSSSPDGVTSSDNPPAPPQHASSSTEAPNQSDSASTSSPLPPPPQTAPDSGSSNAQTPSGVPWGDRPLPSFFIVGPDGRLRPHSPVPPSNGSPTLAQDGPPASTPQPPGPPSGPGMFSFFMPMPTNFRPEPRPDPEAAAELLRSLSTVSKGLFRRVENVVLAEQDQEGGYDAESKGWKCGVCLEGVEDDTKETGVKVLPCNHLFHEACLQPWFTTNHTCPTCRLNLDPFFTLQSSSERGAGRPSPTGAGVASPHPYARSPNHPPTPGPIFPMQLPFVPPPTGENEGPSFTIVWHMPVPNQPESGPPTYHQPTPAPHTPTSPPNPSTESVQNHPRSQSPSTPIMSFDVPLHASPVPMSRNASVSSPSLAPQQAPQNASTEGHPPQPQRRNHVTIVHHHHHGGPPHRHHLFRPPGFIPRPTAPNGTTHAPGSQHAPAGPGGHEGAPPGDGPHMHFFVNIEHGPAPPFGPPGPSPPQGQDVPSPAVPSKVVERESLDSWVSQRERALGWRCDAPECQLAPTDDMDMDEVIPAKESEKDMVSILSPIQTSEGGESFEIHGCDHRWHRTCLEVAEKSCGRSWRGDEQGKIWVRCEKCRKNGWVREKRSERDQAVVC